MARDWHQEVCPLHVYPMFDMVWDIVPCLMHTVPDIWKDHLIPLMKGRRNPAAVKDRKEWTAQQNQKLQRDHVDAKKHLVEWVVSQVKLDIL